MMAAVRDWAAERGVIVGERVDARLAEAFVRYLLLERRVSPRSAAGYLERARGFAIRGGPLAGQGRTTLDEIMGALREEAAEAEPATRAKVRAFHRSFTLADVMLRAIELAREAAYWPAKTGRGKENGPLWAITSQLLDLYVLGDRPAWARADRLAELHGRNLVSLRAEGISLYYPSAVLRDAFGISGHLVRTLVTDATRIARPDAPWAARFMLGHSSREMQETHRTDFAETAAIREYQTVIEGQCEAAFATSAQEAPRQAPRQAPRRQGP